jgi:hypothetical protein
MRKSPEPDDRLELRSELGLAGSEDPDDRIAQDDDRPVLERFALAREVDERDVDESDVALHDLYAACIAVIVVGVGALPEP